MGSLPGDSVDLNSYCWLCFLMNLPLSGVSNTSHILVVSIGKIYSCYSGCDWWRCTSLGAVMLVGSSNGHMTSSTNCPETDLLSQGENRRPFRLSGRDHHHPPLSNPHPLLSLVYFFVSAMLQVVLGHSDWSARW